TMQQSIKAPIIERLDILFLTIWFPTMASSMRAYFFTSYYSIKKLFNFKEHNLFFLCIFALVVVAISRIPSDYETTSNYINFIGVLTFIFVSFLVLSYLLSFINKRGVTIK
ncbi:MAG: GerAB/ArcD/ProY family transporter, partial [Bacillota bacterium]|nr:GerAB/ArcD/ProY family transporter [Bacillota bacterium]